MSIPLKTYLALRTAMERCGLEVSSALPAPTRGTVPEEAYDALWLSLERAGARPEVILRMAQVLPVGAVAPLDLAFLTAPTTRDALSLLSLGWPLVGSPGESLDVRELPDGLRVTMRHGRKSTEDPFSDAFALAVVLTRLRSQARRPIEARRAALALKLTPDSKRAFEHFFAGPVDAGARESWLELSGASTSARQVTADASVHSVLRAQVVEAGRSLPDEVMAEARRWLTRGAALEDVARARGETARTLQRRLADVGLTWRQLRDAVREDEAKFLLAHGRQSLSEIAETLGFSNQAIFTRAFSRWTGVAPSRFRRDSKAKAQPIRGRRPARAGAAPGSRR